MISEENKQRVRRDFDDWLETQERKNEIAKESKALLHDAAAVLEVKPAIIGKIFRILKKKHDDAIDELDEFNEIVGEVFEP